MSTARVPSSNPDLHLQIHQRLIDRDPLAPTDVAVTFLEPLINWLTARNNTLPADFLTEAAEDAILALIKNPASYRPGDSCLETYLRMSAQGDLRNILCRETKHLRGRTSLEAVELSADAGKYCGRDDDPAIPLMIAEEKADLAQQVAPEVRDSLTPAEARVLDLMHLGERRTAVYARAMGITDRPLREQQRLVKQTKDRLKKRIERQGDS